MPAGDRSGETIELFFRETLAGDVTTDSANGDDGATCVVLGNFFPGKPAHALWCKPTLFTDRAVGRPLEFSGRRVHRTHVVGMKKFRDEHAR